MVAGPRAKITQSSIIRTPKQCYHYTGFTLKLLGMNGAVPPLYIVMITTHRVPLGYHVPVKYRCHIQTWQIWGQSAMFYPSHFILTLPS